MQPSPREVSTMSAQTLRQQVHDIADELPAEATWDDVMYQVKLHASIERGLAQAKAGNTIPAEELLAQLQAELRSA